MRYRHLIGFVVCVVTLMCVTPHADAQYESDLLNRINNLRSSLGLAPYSLNGSLTQAAINHAQWMAATGEVSHTQSDGSTPRTRAAAAGYGSQWVSENIYAGNAGVDTAWTFWVNSAVHYRSLTNASYQHVGIGIASGNIGTTYVLVFGGTAPTNFNVSTGNSASANNSSGNGNSEAAPPPPPSFVVGVDAMGNIMHEIQPGDTIGDIALLYGYTWDDVPYMLEINEMDEFSVRELKIGGVLLVPSADGTYTPTPSQPTATVTPLPTDTTTPTQTPTATALSEGQPPPSSTSATLQPSLTPTATPMTVASIPDDNQEALADPEQSRITVLQDRSPWLLIAVGVQVILVLGAGIELVIRYFKR